MRIRGLGSRGGARHGAARRTGCRPRGVVGRGLLPRGGRGGRGDRRGLRAGDRQAGRAGLPSQSKSMREAIAAALEAGQPPDFAFGLQSSAAMSRQWAFDDRLVDLTDAIGHFLEPVRSGCARLGDVAQRETGQKALYGLPMGRTTNHVHVWKSLLEQRGVHSRRHPEGVGRVLVVLVRPGAAGGAQGHRPRRHLGRRPVHGGRRSTPRTGSSSSWLHTRRSTSPATARSSSTIPRSGASSIKAIDELHRLSTAKAAPRPMR